jgi:hypothetical protein
VANFFGQNISLAQAGAGIAFSGLCVIKAPPASQPTMSGSFGSRLVVLSIFEGAYLQAHLFHGGGKITPITQIADRTNYRIGFVCGDPAALLKNIDEIDIVLRPIYRSVGISGSTNVANLMAESVPLRVPAIAADITPPTAYPSAMQPS